MALVPFTEEEQVRINLFIYCGLRIAHEFEMTKRCFLQQLSVLYESAVKMLCLLIQVVAFVFFAYDVILAHAVVETDSLLTISLSRNPLPGLHL